MSHRNHRNIYVTQISRISRILVATLKIKTKIYNIIKGTQIIMAYCLLYDLNFCFNFEDVRTTKKSVGSVRSV